MINNSTEKERSPGEVPGELYLSESPPPRGWVGWVGGVPCRCARNLYPLQATPPPDLLFPLSHQLRPGTSPLAPGPLCHSKGTFGFVYAGYRSVSHTARADLREQGLAPLTRQAVLSTGTH